MLRNAQLTEDQKRIIDQALGQVLAPITEELFKEFLATRGGEGNEND